MVWRSEPRPSSYCDGFSPPLAHLTRRNPMTGISQIPSPDQSELGSPACARRAAWPGCAIALRCRLVWTVPGWPRTPSEWPPAPHTASWLTWWPGSSPAGALMETWLCVLVGGGWGWMVRCVSMRCFVKERAWHVINRKQECHNTTYDFISCNNISRRLLKPSLHRRT